MGGVVQVLITGGAGFIGSHTADALIACGCRVRLLDNLSEPVHPKGKANYQNPCAELLVGDVRNRADWERALTGVDVVFHFAAHQDYLPDFSTFFDVNATGTAMLYEVVASQKIRLKKVIIASSQGVYGEGKYQRRDGSIVYPGARSRRQLMRAQWECAEDGEPLIPLWTDESVVRPQSPYAISKYSQEMVSLSLGQRYDIPTTCLRYSIVQGPRQSFYNAYSGACRIFSLANRVGKRPVIYEDGNQTRDFVNIEDVVAANLLVLESREADYRCFNVGGGCRWTVLEFARLAAEVWKKSFDPIVNGEFRVGDTRHIMSDTSSLEGLGWHAKRDCHYSLESYKAWLLDQEMATEDTLGCAYARMRELQTLQTAEEEKGMY